MRKKKEALRKALRGDLREHHRLIMTQLLADISWCEEQAQEISAEIARRLHDNQEMIDRLDEIPGVNERIAQIILAEVGPTWRSPHQSSSGFLGGFVPGQ